MGRNTSLGEELRMQFEEAVSFGDVSLSKEIGVREISDESIIINFKLISDNVTSSQTTPLETVANDLMTARLQLDRVRDELERFLEGPESFKLGYEESEYQYERSSFRVDVPEIKLSTWSRASS